eukprot:m.55142 g.55142  ORF g.55142 m.55142 type:complete len:110 (+) comp10968_c0_seq1:33-362(+)
MEPHTNFNHLFFRRLTFNFVSGTCEGSTVTVPMSDKLLFSTPLSSSRSNMTVFTSNDFGDTWEIMQHIDSGPSAYSSLTPINSTHVGLTYESKSYGALTFLILQVILHL